MAAEREQDQVLVTDSNHIGQIMESDVSANKYYEFKCKIIQIKSFTLV